MYRLSQQTSSRVLLVFALCLSLASLFTTILVSPARAYDLTDGVNLKDKPSTWCQGCADSDFGYTKDISMSFEGGSNDITMAGGSCGQHSLAATLVRSGVKPQGYTVMDMRKEVQVLQSGGKDSPYSVNGWLYQETPGGFEQGIKNLTQDKMEVTVQGDTSNANQGANKFPASDIAKAWEEGYFVVFMVVSDPSLNGNAGASGRHWVAVDSVSSDGTIHLLDSGDEYTTLDPKRYPPPYGPILKFKRADGKKSTEVKAENGAATGSFGTAPTDSNQSDQQGIKLLSEADLPGMPPKTKGTELQMSQADAASFVIQGFKESTYANLTENQKQNVDEIAANKKLEDRDTIYSVPSLVLTILGILLFLYSVGVFLAFVLDTAVPLGATTIVTFKRLYVMGDSNQSGAREANWKTVGTLVFSLASVGALCFTGTLLWVLTYVLSFFY